MDRRQPVDRQTAEQIKEITAALSRLAGECGYEIHSHAFATYASNQANASPTNREKGLKVRAKPVQRLLMSTNKRGPGEDTIQVLRNWLIVDQAETDPKRLTRAPFVLAHVNRICRSHTIKEIREYVTSPSIEIIQVVGAGGMGKTAVLLHLRQDFAASEWQLDSGKIHSHFEFSFSDQGQPTNDAQTVERGNETKNWLTRGGGTATYAFQQLAQHYGVEYGGLSPEALGSRLAAKHVNLGGVIVLDGVETQLETKGLDVPQPGLSQFLLHLTDAVPDQHRNAAGRLVILATRWPVGSPLNMHEGKCVKTIWLKPLDPRDGAAFLEEFEMSCNGEQRRISFSPEFADDQNRRRQVLENIAKALGSPLSLVLFASQLIEGNAVVDGTADDLLRSLDEGGDFNAERIARRMVERYDQFFRGDDRYGPHLDVLRQLSMFSRTQVTLAELKSLWKRDIAGVVNRRDYIAACRELTRLGLVNAEWRRRDELPDELVVHPIIRVFYRDQFQRELPSAWHEGHKRLYEYYASVLKRTDASEMPIGLILLAVRSAIEAGLHRTAFALLTDERTVVELARSPAILSDLASAYLGFFLDPPLWRLSNVQGEELNDIEKSQVSLRAAGYRVATHGMADKVARDAYGAAETAAHALGGESALLTKVAALVGSWRYHLVRGEIAESLTDARRLELYRHDPCNDGYVGAVCDVVSFISRFFAADGENDADANQEVPATKPASIEVRQERLRQFPSLYDPLVNLRLFQSWKAWLEGKVCWKYLKSALKDARRINDYSDTVIAYHCAASLAQYNGNVRMTRRWAAALAEVTRGTQEVFLTFGGHFLSTWADGITEFMRSGTFPKSRIDVMLSAVQRWRASGAELIVPYFLTVVADALIRNKDFTVAKQHLARAKKSAETTGEKWWYAETMRLYAICCYELGQEHKNSRAACDAWLNKSCDAVRDAWLAAKSQGGKRLQRRIETLPFFDAAQARHNFRR